MGKVYRYDVIDRKTGQVSLRGATPKAVADLLCMKVSVIHTYADKGMVAKKRWLIRKREEDNEEMGEFYHKFGMTACEFDRQMDDIREMFGLKRRTAQ